MTYSSPYAGGGPFAVVLWRVLGPIPLNGGAVYRRAGRAYAWRGAQKRAPRVRCRHSGENSSANSIPRYRCK